MVKLASKQQTSVERHLADLTLQRDRLAADHAKTVQVREEAQARLDDSLVNGYDDKTLAGFESIIVTSERRAGSLAAAQLRVADEIGRMHAKILAESEAQARVKQAAAL